MAKDLLKIPTHIGIIMDGNGRWAKKQNLVRTKGHIAGIDATKKTLLYAIKAQVQFVTLYVFSTENWKRPKSEVLFILDMLAKKLREHYVFYEKHDIKIVYSGNLHRLGKKIIQELTSVIKHTKNNTTITLNLAFNYGGRDEIIRAFTRFQNSNKTSSSLTEKTFSKYLDQPHIPFPDLLIRTGAQKRISNFLLWQLAYTELYFSDVLWPDWNENHMALALKFYKNQKRNFGNVT